MELLEGEKMENLEEMLKLLDEEINFIWEHEDSFRKKFMKFKTAFEFYEVSFTPQSVNFKYILESGRHISDSAFIEEYQKWKSSIIKSKGQK